VCGCVLCGCGCGLGWNAEYSVRSCCCVCVDGLCVQSGPGAGGCEPGPGTEGAETGKFVGRLWYFPTELVINKRKLLRRRGTKEKYGTIFLVPCFQKSPESLPGLRSVRVTSLAQVQRVRRERGSMFMEAKKKKKKPKQQYQIKLGVRRDGDRMMQSRKGVPRGDW
jgi:hypothetical protein